MCWKGGKGGQGGLAVGKTGAVVSTAARPVLQVRQKVHLARAEDLGSSLYWVGGGAWLRPQEVVSL